MYNIAQSKSHASESAWLLLLSGHFLFTQLAPYELIFVGISLFDDGISIMLIPLF